MGSVKFSIHPLFFIFGIYYAFVGKVFLFLVYTFTAVIHEVGHSFVAGKMGYELNKITLMPYGAIVGGKTEGLKKKDEILIALAGPLTNFIIAVFFVATWWFFPITYAYTDTAVYASVSIALINLLPFFPLDGGRILLCLLSEKIGEQKAQKFCRALSCIFGGAIILCFVITCFYKVNLTLLFFGGFIFFGALAKKSASKYVPVRRFLGEEELKRGLPVKIHAVSEEMTVKKLISIMDFNAYNKIEIYKNGKKQKTLEEKDLEKILQNSNLYAKLKDI